MSAVGKKDDADPKPETLGGFEFGNFDKGIVGTLLIVSLMLVGTMAYGVLGSSGSLFFDTPEVQQKALTNDTVIETGQSGSLQATAPAIAPIVTFIAECFEVVLILIILTVVTYIIWKLLSWLEKRCKKCKCSWNPKTWGCCAGKLICWIVKVFKWVAVAVTVILAVATFVTFIVCIFSSKVVWF